MTEMLRFWAFQRWFRIENRTIIKDFRAILLIFVSFGLPQTIGGAFIREGVIIRDNTVYSQIWSFGGSLKLWGHVSFGLPQTIGDAFIREGAIISDNTVYSQIWSFVESLKLWGHPY